MAGARKGSSKKTAGRAAQAPAEDVSALSEQERQRMIAESAYYRALRRGFGGDPAQDWLEAEREINRLMPGARQQKDEHAAYEKLRDDVRAALADAREVTASTAREALEGARRRLADAGAYTVDTVDKVAATVEKELAEAAHKFGEKRHALAGKAADAFESWRDRGQAFVLEARAALGQWIQQAGARLERPVYRTGEMVGSGIFQCRRCEERIEMTTDGHLPLCSKCRGVEFHRA